MKCSNHIGYGKDGDPEKWGANVCNQPSARDCSRCHKPACAKHLDISMEGHPNAKPVCMDCYEAQNAAVAERLSVRNKAAVAATRHVRRASQAASKPA
jgi:hypothetical protein